MKKACIVTLAVVLALVLSSALVGQEYSADETTVYQGNTVKIKVFVAKGMRRQEMSVQGMSQPAISIIRLDKNVMWVLMPNNVYMESPLSPEMAASMQADKAPGEIDRKLVGKETLNGISVDKYRVNALSPTKEKTVYSIWVDKDGLALKVVDDKGSMSMVLSNVVKGKQPAELFEPPKGYTLFKQPNAGQAQAAQAAPAGQPAPAEQAAPVGPPKVSEEQKQFEQDQKVKTAMNLALFKAQFPAPPAAADLGIPSYPGWRYDANLTFKNSEASIEKLRIARANFTANERKLYGDYKGDPSITKEKLEMNYVFVVNAPYEKVHAFYLDALKASQEGRHANDGEDQLSINFATNKQDNFTQPKDVLQLNGDAVSCRIMIRKEPADWVPFAGKGGQ